MKKKVLMLACSCFLMLGFFSVDRALAETIELKISHFMPTKHVQHTRVMAPWAERIEKLTDGRVKVTIFPGGALGTPPISTIMPLRA